MSGAARGGGRAVLAEATKQYRRVRLVRALVDKSDLPALERATHALLDEAMRLAAERGRERRARGEELPGSGLLHAQRSLAFDVSAAVDDG